MSFSMPEEAMVVSDEAVEKALVEAGSFYIGPSRDEVRAILVAALPVIERDLREQIAREIEVDLVGDPPDRSALPGPDAKWEGYLLALVESAARVREGGRS